MPSPPLSKIRLPLMLASDGKPVGAMPSPPLASIVLLSTRRPLPDAATPCPSKPVMRRPRTVTSSPEADRPATLRPADDPSSTTSGEPTVPGWVLPSMRTESVMSGSAVPGVIVRIPPPGMSNAIRSAPSWLFASLIASRRLQWLESQPKSSASSSEVTTIAGSG